MKFIKEQQELDDAASPDNNDLQIIQESTVSDKTAKYQEMQTGMDSPQRSSDVINEDLDDVLAQ